MDLNADFSKRILLHGDAIAWTPSPTTGVDRRMLDRIGNEVARATSIVRYAPGSLFPPHVHRGGEEFIVVEGVFQDEHGDYPPGTYVRNPPTTEHRPGSENGCTIFVKLWQFDPHDRESVRINMNSCAQLLVENRPGVQAARLFEGFGETVQIETWTPGAMIDMNVPDGAELLVLEGDCVETGEAMRALSWLRVPSGGRIAAVAGESGTRVWVKTGGARSSNAPVGHRDAQ